MLIYTLDRDAVSRSSERSPLAPRRNGHLARAQPRHWVAREAAGVDAVTAELAAQAQAAWRDMGLAISAYLEAAEVVRRRAEAEALACENLRVAQALGASLTALAQGDLTFRLPAGLPEAYANLGDEFNQAMAELEQALSAVTHAAANIDASSEQVAQASNDL